MKTTRTQSIAWRICSIFITLFILVFVFTFFLADMLNYEFRKVEYAQTLYLCLICGVPVCVCLTMVRSIIASNSILLNVLVVLGTITGSYIITYVVVIATFMYGFGGWITEEILYRSKTDQTIMISEQLFDEGALGYGGRRIAKLEPFLGYWYHVEEVDTNGIDQAQWTRVNEMGNVKFP